jgi:diacylglycerol kinase family enzyme
MLAQFSRPPAFNVTMTLSERRSNQVLSALAVFNNPLGPGHMPYADRLDSGVLGIYTAGVLSRAAYLKLSADLIAGSWSSNADLREARTERIVLEFSALRRRTSSALIDGELVALERHVEIRLEPQGLKVLRPNRDR